MSMENVKPLSNRVLIKRSEAKVSKGGIILPDAAKEKPKQGEVVAVGPGKMDDQGRLMKLNVNIGDQVLFSSYAGTEVKTEEQGVEYLIMVEDDILGVLV